MENIIYGIAVLGSAIGLTKDYFDRQRFNKFKDDKKVDDKIMIEGLLTSPNPLRSSLIDNNNNDVIISKSEKEHKHFHTYYREAVVYNDDIRKISVPVAETYYTWDSAGSDFRLASPLFLGKYPLNLSNNSRIYYDKDESQVLNNTKTTEKSISNNQIKAAFGKNVDGTFSAISLGNEKEIIDDIRGNHFGISNWKTGCYGIILSASLGILLNNLNNKNNKN